MTDTTLARNARQALYDMGWTDATLPRAIRVTALRDALAELADRAERLGAATDRGGGTRREEGGTVKASNDYVRALGQEAMFDAVPKAVFAALCYSFAMRSGGVEESADVCAILRDEWAVLHVNGIVPQKPAAGTRLRTGNGVSR